MKTFGFIIFMLVFISLPAQKNMADLPYRTIPEYNYEYNAHTVLARMLDGFGFRYYWATQDLLEEDLATKASESGRTIAQTLDHIYGLARTTYNAIFQKPNLSGEMGSENMSLAEKRKATLDMIKAASDHLKLQETPISEMKVVFRRGEKQSEYPFWNVLNGPLEDAIWHVGQVVMLRRAAGNPIPGGISLFSGTIRIPK